MDGIVDQSRDCQLKVPLSEEQGRAIPDLT
jgi:hypothetical protein